MSGCHTTGWCRVCLGMLKHRCLDNIQACRPLGVLGLRCTSQRTAELDGNGDFLTGSQKVTKIAQKSNFIVQAGTHDLAAIYYTSATFVPPGTDENIAQDASKKRTIYQRQFLQNLLHNGPQKTSTREPFFCKQNIRIFAIIVK